jgi:acyl-coenzyme A synthetase/AMP-(fatty) acid ligase
LGLLTLLYLEDFPAEALLSRIQDADAKLVITADGGFRKGGAFALNHAVDEALKGKHNVKNVVVVRRTRQETAGILQQISGGTILSIASLQNTSLKALILNIHYSFCTHRELQQSQREFFIQLVVI